MRELYDMVQSRRRHDWIIAATIIGNIATAVGATCKIRDVIPEDLRLPFVETPPSEW